MSDATPEIAKEPPYCLLASGIMEALKLKLINQAAAVLHGQIRLWMNKAYNDVAWAGLAALGEEIGMSERSVKRQLKVLENLGFVHRIKRPGTTDLIRAVDRPDVWFDAWGEKPESVKKAARNWVELSEDKLSPQHPTQDKLAPHPGQVVPAPRTSCPTIRKIYIYLKIRKRKTRGCKSLLTKQQATTPNLKRWPNRNQKQPP